MKNIKSVNEWFDFRSKDEKEGDEIIESIISGIQIENPNIEVTSPDDEDWRGKIYTFTLDKLVGFDDENIVVENLYGRFRGDIRSPLPERKRVTISGHRLDYTKKRFKSLITLLESIVESPIKSQRNDIKNRLKFYKK